MKFEISYANASKVVVEIADAQLFEILDAKAKGIALQSTDKIEQARGVVVSAKVV